LERKKAPKYSVLWEGARRVEQSTIVEEFARQEDYTSPEEMPVILRITELVCLYKAN